MIVTGWLKPEEEDSLRKSQLMYPKMRLYAPVIK